MSYVVVAELRMRPERREEFLALMHRHAALSISEPGCRLFEVAVDDADRDLVLLYELYDDDAAYQSHRETPHYAQFRKLAPALLVAEADELFRRRSVMRRIDPSPVATG